MALADLQQQSVQSKPKANGTRSQTLDFFATQRGPILDAYGSHRRTRQLLDVYRNQYNWAVQGAFSNIAKVIGSTPWEIRAPKDQRHGAFGIDYFQDVFENANFGAGYLHMMQQVVLDILRYDHGAFIELIAPGSARGAVDGPVSGLAHLDSLRCFPTGDPQFPVLYVDRDHTMHTLHHTRVIRMVDNPDGDDRKPGYGLCALSRAIAISMREIRMGQYIEGMLDDRPAPGLVTASGFNEAQRDAAVANYQSEQTADSLPVWGNQLWFFGLDRDAGAKLEFHTFMQPPEKFDFEVYTGKVDMPALALALGLDVQDLWQLTGGNIGSAVQSEILHQKNVGKLIGTLRNELERRFNFDVLPEDFSFHHTFKDTQEDRARAETADIWVKGISVASAHLSDDETRRMLATVDDRYSDVLLTEDGEVVVRDDQDILAPDQEQTEIADGVQTSTTPDNGDDSPRTADRQLALDLGGPRYPDLVQGGSALQQVQQKAFQATRLTFELDWANMIQAAKDGGLPRRRFRFVSRALLRRHGLQAMKDGLAEGGVLTDTLAGDDLSTYTAWLAARGDFVNGLAERLYAQGEQINADTSAAMWANNSLQAVYYAGLNSAARNGMMAFTGSDGDESCATCQRLKPQVHRMSTWTRRRLRPGVDVENFICGGFRCNHTLTRTTARAQGRL